MKKLTKKIQHQIPTFIQPQLPTVVEKPPLEKNWLHEIKFDGMRIQVHIEGKIVKLYDWKGEERSNEFPTLIKAVLDLKVKNAIFDAEAVILDRQGKTQFLQLEKALRFKDDTQIKLFFFDLLYLNNSDQRSLPLLERKEKLKDLIPDIHPRLRFSDHVFRDPESFFNINCKQQLEGIISKVSTAPYTSGKNSYWCQTKCSKTQEFVIAGFSEATNEFLLGFYEREKFLYVGKVTAEEKFLKIKKKLVKQDLSAFEKFPKAKGVSWVKPEVKAEINFSNWTDEKHLRNPVFLELVLN